MKLGGLFVLLSLLIGLSALRLPAGRQWILLWPCVSFLAVGLAYLGLGPRVFGKRPDGRMALASTVLLLPYLLCVWTTWRLWRLVCRKEPYQELAPGIIIGRRLFPAEYPDRIDCVLDLTCEFPEFRAVREGKEYRSFPILDGHVPKSRGLVELIARLDHVRGTLYIHCAEGHGRAGLVAAAILLARGRTADPDEAVRMVQASRPGVKLKRRQRETLAEVAEALTRHPGVASNNWE